MNLESTTSKANVLTAEPLLLYGLHIKTKPMYINLTQDFTRDIWTPSFSDIESPTFRILVLES